MNDFTAFTKVIEEFITLFDHLISIEQEKLDAAVKNRVTFVEDCMHKEQAAVLQLRGLEQKRETEQKRLGMEGFTFRRILEEAPSETAASLKPLFDQLSERVTAFRSVSDSAKNIIEVNLHMIQSALAAEGPGQDTYTAAGKKNDNDNRKRFTSRSV
ncbi:MAG: flagellar protein FlgN [Dorea sp.]|nr:flagellar protein FlgN [Dorea sp.]MCI9229292.1 flagellar protein FlgN [Dorea sp.]